MIYEAALLVQLTRSGSVLLCLNHVARIPPSVFLWY
jgi:hypothetical protein